MECLRNKFQDGVILNGRYQTISPLNHGSFGMVFMARDLHNSDIVAIKCLTKKSAANEAGLDFAIDDNSEELLCHHRLGDHPNIVNLTDSFETDSHLYLVIEFCPRGDLYEAIRNGYGPLETEHVRQFMLELVDAVAYMHDMNIYHRDIKPENIFLTQSGAMKLGDFGLATTDAWSYENTVGSDRYMAPEQYDSAGAGYSPAQADIWAIGICLLNILFSRNPFTTPTESDPLFLDFSRDKQSLFDVFPTMSQDTFEVIVECMNLDPQRRSLSGVRDALDRAISFTTIEEDIDDFCVADARAFATANREPLRTPSIQSPQVDTGAFPWAKALHASPQPIRQLSAILDNESYSEDLFPKSEESGGWFSAGSAQTPSMSSLMTSNLAASMQSLNFTRPLVMPARATARASAVAGSLPITMSKPRPAVNSMSMVFGRKDTVSKSWSDMWEEDVEEEENERAHQLETLKELNSRTWSHENTPTPVQDPASPLMIDTQARPSGDEKPEASPVNDTLTNDIDGDLVADGFFFHAPPATQPVTPSAARYSPPSKRSTTNGGGLDKWSALGQRRRAQNSGASEGEKSPDLFKSKRFEQSGFAFNQSNGVGNGLWGQHFGGQQQQQQEKLSEKNHTNTNNMWYNNQSKHENTRDRSVGTKTCPWISSPWRKEKRLDHFGDVEWVGGWQEAH